MIKTRKAPSARGLRPRVREPKNPPPSSQATAELEAPQTSELTAPTTKLDAVIAALKAPGGASVPDLVDLTGWQEKSVRGFMAGALKKKRGLTIVSAKEGTQRIYRIVEPQA